MCGRYYRQYRCGHRRYGDEAIYNRATQRWSMCQNSQRTTIAVSDHGLCGRTACYLEDLKRNGWTCCRCGDVGNRMDGCLGPPRGHARCDHWVCARCTYS
ncbi:hypothetical protein GQ44DRAFT_739974 [Phaeosphaeriaceae sp. PMI808]|nr:hypothetical protein GQ44DRAFT_739974 [Phaeosphaeriaceae sp. PMI808]